MAITVNSIIIITIIIHRLAAVRDDCYHKRFGAREGYDWVGWRNDSLGWAGKPVEMVFEFDSVRNFSSMVLHTNNMFSKDVQVFVHAKVFFSIGGQHFTGEPVQFSYMPDTVMENARDVTIKLHHRVGRYVQIHLYFALRWIMLSEISFNSAHHFQYALTDTIGETLKMHESVNVFIRAMRRPLPTNEVVLLLAI
uniref:Discoidin domain-containing protein n=1 Tax=Anopheles quadriannulatus TaxID=34691 RepID=A0A182X672_ANOQN